MRMRSLIPVGAGVLATTLASCSTARSAESPEHAADAAVPVRVQPAAAVDRPHTTVASGVVEARTTVDVAFQVPGKVVEVGPDEGDAVSAGQLLARVDPTDYRLAVDQAAAQAEHAARERDRFRALVEAGSVAPNDYERVESAARQSGAGAGLAGKRLADTRLASPITGVVARRAIDRGETAAPGQTVFTVVDMDPVRVRIGVPEADVGAVRAGQPASVRLPALGDTTFNGRVTLVGVAADPATRSYAVEVSVPNPRRRIKVGMVAEASVRGDRRERAVAVPLGAVVRDADGATLLYVLDQNGGRVHARRVTLGQASGDDVEVLRGLAAGEPVVVAGQHRVRDGSRVSVQRTDMTIDAAESAGGVR